MSGTRIITNYLDLSADSRHLHRSQHRLGLVHGFLEFLGGIGIGDDAGAGLQVGVLALHQHGADGNTRVEIASEIGVEDGASVDASAHWFEFFDDLHGAYFRGSAEGARGKAGGEGIEGVQAVPQFAF